MHMQLTCSVYVHHGSLVCNSTLKQPCAVHAMFVYILCRISCVGIYVASMITGKGPYSLLLEHVQDPVHHNAVQNLL